MYTKASSTLLLALFALLLVSVNALPRVRSYVHHIHHYLILEGPNKKLHRSYTWTSHLHQLNHYHPHHSICKQVVKCRAKWLIRPLRHTRPYMIFPMIPWLGLRMIVQQQRHQQPHQRRLVLRLVRRRWLRVCLCWRVWRDGCRRLRAWWDWLRSLWLLEGNRVKFSDMVYL